MSLHDSTVEFPNHSMMMFKVGVSEKQFSVDEDMKLGLISKSLFSLYPYPLFTNKKRQPCTSQEGSFSLQPDHSGTLAL